MRKPKTVSIDRLKAARRRLSRIPLIGRVRREGSLKTPLDERIEGLLLYYQALGYPLTACADPRRLGVTLAELQKICDRLKLAFSDYKPKRKAKPKAKTPAKPKAAPKRKAPRRAPRQSMSKPPRRRSFKR